MHLNVGLCKPQWSFYPYLSQINPKSVFIFPAWVEYIPSLKNDDFHNSYGSSHDLGNAEFVLLWSRFS